MSKWGKISYTIFVLSIVVLMTSRLLIGGWIDYLFIPLVLAALSFIAAIAVDYKFYLDFLSMKTTKHGMNMGVLILLALLLVAAINYLGVRFDKTFDLTKEKINSLSDQSVNVVKGLKDDLQILIFYKGQNLKERAREIKSDFRLFEAVGSKLKVRVVDANRDVELAKKYLQSGDAFVALADYKGRKAVIQPSLGTPDRPVYQERDVTSTLVKITREKPMAIYFVTGHGEKDIEQASVDGIKTFADLLRDDGYEVSKLNLITDDKELDPTGVIAIVGPQKSFDEKELQRIRDFAKNGGRLFVAADPGENHHMALLTKSFGVEFKNNYILNEVQGTDEGLVGAVGVEFDPASPVTKKLAGGRALAVFPFASALDKAPDASADYTYREILKTHPRSYVANSPNATGKDAERRQHAMAMTVKGEKFAGVFFGDSDFLSDVRIARWVHLDLAMNAVAFLFDDEMNLTIRPKSLESTQLQITNAKGMGLAIAGVGLPLLLIVMSGFFWYRRRSL